MRKILLLALSIFSFLAAFAQVDTEFWFAAPHICEHSRVTGGYHMVLFSYDKPAHIELSMPANSAFVTKTYDLNAYDYVDIEMAQDYDDAVANFEVPFDVVSQRGIHITSTSKIGGYYNHTGNNAEAYSLKNEALGTNFGVVSQTVFQIQSESETYEDAYSSAQIVATEDNTIVTITPVTGHPVSPNCNATPIVVHLNRGETYAVKSCSKDPLYGVNGMRISSNKPIAVCSTDDSTQAGTGAAGLDLTGEQLVSLDFAGKRYAAIGQQNSWNSCSITALENGTTVTLSTGQVLNMQKDETQNISMATVQALYIESNKDVLVYQITGEDDEAAGTMLPALDCTGSRYVAYKRMPDSYMTFLNIVTKSSNINSIYINNSKVASSQFHPVPGTGNAWYYASIQKSGADDFLTVECKSGFIQLGVLDMKGTSLTNLKSCTYGYFSDYGSAHEYDEYATFDEGTTYIWKNHFLPGTTTPMSFATAGVYTDNLTDRQGCDSICILHLSKIPYPDNVADVECVVPPSATSFEMQELFRAEGAHSMSTPLVGDIDGDGITEIVTCYSSTDKEFWADGLIVYNGINGQTKDTIIVASYALSGQPIAMADVDHDSKSEIFILALDMYVYCYEHNGNLRWKSSATIANRFVPQLADINNDGVVELVMGEDIFNASTGQLLLHYSMETSGMGFAAPNAINVPLHYLPFYIFALYDIDGDGSLELCAGNTIYKYNLANTVGTSGNSYSILRQAQNHPIYSNWNYDGQTFVVDFDNDGDGDVCVIGVNHDVANVTQPYYIDTYVWDGQSDEFIAYNRTNAIDKTTRDGWKTTSIPYCGDLNGDNFPEIVYNLYGLGMIALSYESSAAEKMRKLHEYAPFAETSGFTVFDFNMDGKSEIVYRGVSSLSIVDGETLSDLSTPVSMVSVTMTEYPVVADVNGDGAAEIVITYTDSRYKPTGWVGVFGSANSGIWSSARPVWNQWAYNSVNINEDMTVPQYQYDVATLFPNGTKPFNSFLAQKPIIDKQGDIFVPAADAAVTSCTSEVINDSVNITISFCNNGDANLIAPYEIAVYQNEYRGRVVQVDTIKETLPISGCKTATIKVPALSVCQAAVDNSFIIAINDNGHGIAQHGNQQAECDTTNNRTSIVLPPNLRRDTTYVNIIIEQGDTYTFNGHTYSTAAQDTATFIAASGCDSVCILDLKVIPYPDNVTEVPCTVDPPANVWSIRRSAISTQDLLDDCSTTMVGDIDGDGQVEIIAPINGETMQYEKIGIFDAQANVKRIINIPGISIFTNIAIAKIKTGEGQYTTLFFFLAYDKYIYAYTPTGTQYWKSDQPFSHNDGELVPIASLSLADFNHDGWAEIYLGSEIFDAATGKRLCAYNGNRGHADRSWKASRQMYQSVAADVTGDSNLELLIGNCACSVNINSRTDATQNSIIQAVVVPTSLMKMEDNSSIPSTDGFTLSADMDADGKLDAVVMWIDKSNRVLYVYIWNPRDGTILGTRKIVNVSEFGTPNIGDIDNDGNLELNFIIGTQPGETTDANDRIFSLKYNKSTHSLDVFWTLHHDDASGATGLTLFDFNQDGTKEIVYRDCENLRIINGSMKHHLTGAPVAAPYDLATIPCTSGTATEYPVIADVDADGEAEIVVVGEWKLQVYKSNLEPWAPARKVWNQYAYNITNVNEDLTIPQYQYNNAHKFTDASSVVRQPYNTFLSQVTTINSQGVPFIAAADVATTVASAPSFANDSVTFDVSYCNQGSLQLNAPYSITTYAKTYRGTVLHIDTIYDILSVGDCEQKTVKFPVAALCADASINKLIIAINDDGKGIAQHGEQQAECDTTNNTLSINIPNIHTDTTRFAPVICATELPYTHPETGIVFPIGFSKPDSCETHTNQFGCDSVVQVKITINPILYGDTMASTYGNSFQWYGEEYTSSGDYPHTLTSKVTGCDSIVTLHLKMLSYEENCYSTEGTEFFVAFMPNGGSDTEELKLFATSRYNASMTISNPRMGWSTSISIPANGSNSIIIPNNYGFTSETEFETVLNKGLIVTSTAPISLFASNALEGSHRDWDAANILPTSILSSKYIIQTITPTNPGRPEFALLATEDGTTIDINLTAQTSGGHKVGKPYQITLNRGQVYMCYSSSATADFSGTLIDAHGKKIAVFNGVNQTCIPSDKKAADHLYEQAIPIENLGKKFAITSTRERQRDLVKITAISNSTDIFVDGVKVTTINARQSYEFTVVSPQTSCYIETSNPVVCNLFLMSHAVNNQFRSNMGDPAMVAVYPIEQTTDYITFATVSTSQTCEHYVNIVTATNNINEIKVDGSNITSSFELLSGNSAYSFARLAVTEGSHTISSTGTGFLGHVYGLARVESYAYNLGTTVCELIDYNLDGDTTKLTICEGDDSHWNGLSPTTTGLYDAYVKSVVTGFDSLCVLDLTVNPKLYGDTAATFCNGHPFKWHGVDYPTGGDYTYTYTSKVTGCDSIVTLHLTQLEPTDSIENVTICEGETHYWHGNPYTTTTDITETIANAAGCDSVCTLHLKVNPKLSGDTAATFCNGHPFNWHGVDYPTAGNYPYTYTSKVTGCDSIVTLHLTQLEPTDSIEIVTICAGGSHTWHGHIYTTNTTVTETIDNAVGCDSVCTLKLTVLPQLIGDTSATFCNGTPFMWHGTPYATGGDYPYMYTSKVAPYCDSIVTLHLTQLEPTDSVENVTLCYGESHVWHGQTFTTSTTITETIPNAAGCDSVCTLNLTILPALTGDTSATFCNGKSFTWHGTQYSIAGNYPYSYTSKVAPYCDSIVTLHLTQLEPTDSVENVSLCYGESHVWHGQTFTTSTTITETIPNAAGCDSVCTLNLTILPALTGDTSATFCNGTPFIWHDTPYATGGDYQYTYTSKVAPYCDSIVTLHLTQLEPTDSIEVVTICYGGSHTWHGHTYTATTTTTETIDNAVGCDSVCTLKLTVLPAITGDTNMTVCDTLLPVTWRGQSITGAGEYYHTATASSGCDSTITLHVTVETCLTPALTCDTLEATFIVPDICADDDSMYIDITYTKGLPVSYNVTFGADAVAQGFQSSYTGNVRITSSTTASISIPIPNDPTNRQVYPKPNVYSIDISILDTCDAYTTWRSQNFLIHYPSWLTLQRWNDVISLYNERYNGGYVFSQIRWFHEGTLLESRGDHDGYIYQRPTLVYGDAYWAELTRADDGVTITTCPIYPVPMTDSTKMDDVTDPYIIVTPTVVTPSNPTVTVKTNICGEYYVYYVDGHLLDKQNFCPKDNHTFTIDIDPCYVRTGLYILVFYGEEGTIKAVKLLVEP